MAGEAAVTVLGAKGQVVIPKQLRDRLRMGPKTRFVVFGSGDVIILKRLDIPELEAKWKRVLATVDAKGLRISEREVGGEVTAARKARRRRARK